MSTHEADISMTFLCHLPSFVRQTWKKPCVKTSDWKPLRTIYSNRILILSHHFVIPSWAINCRAPRERTYKIWTWKPPAWSRFIQPWNGLTGRGMFGSNEKRPSRVNKSNLRIDAPNRRFLPCGPYLALQVPYPFPPSPSSIYWISLFCKSNLHFLYIMTYIGIMLSADIVNDTSRDFTKTCLIASRCPRTKVTWSCQKYLLCYCNMIIFASPTCTLSLSG